MNVFVIVIVCISSEMLAILILSSAIVLKLVKTHALR